MAFLDSYRQQVALLIRVLPFVAEERIFALKGGRLDPRYNITVPSDLGGS